MPYGAPASDIAYIRLQYEQGTERDSIEDLGYVVVTADDGSMGASTVDGVIFRIQETCLIP